MKHIFYSNNIAEVYLVCHLLRSHGIAAEVDNEILLAARGDVPPTDTSSMPCVWIADESRAAEAERIIRDRKPHVVEEEWTCAGCGNANPGTFTACWNCQREKS